MVFASALTGGAVLRASGRIFLGLGTAGEGPDEFSVPGDEVDPEASYRRDRVPLTMTIPTIALLVIGLAVGLVPGLAGDATAAAARFVDRPAYVATVLDGAPSPDTSGTFAGPDAKDWLFAALAMGGAISLAAVGLLRGRLRETLGRGPRRSARAGLAGLRALHSGHWRLRHWLVVALRGRVAATYHLSRRRTPPAPRRRCP